MDLLLISLKVLLVSMTAAANAFYLLAIVAGYRFSSWSALKSAARPLRTQPPVSIMIPLRGADFHAYENYRRLCHQNYPKYQLVFGVHDENDSSVPIVRSLQSDFPERDIQLVVDARTLGQNAKVSNLQNMLSSVKHEYIVIVDSDIRVEPDYLAEVMAELEQPGVGLVTCLYRASDITDFGSRLEAIGITAEFAAGVLMAWMLEGVKFALGSTMATTRTRLDEIGGFRALADYLADDFMLGNLIAQKGYEVRLSSHIVETSMPPAGIGGMIRHQMRWARSTRISRPLGYLGLVLTYGTALAGLNLIVSRASFLSLCILIGTLLIRMAMALLIGVKLLRDRALLRYVWLVPARDLLSFGIWVVSWVGRKVEWRGRSFEVQRDGKMILAD